MKQKQLGGEIGNSKIIFRLTLSPQQMIRQLDEI